MESEKEKEPGPSRLENETAKANSGAEPKAVEKTANDDVSAARGKSSESSKEVDRTEEAPATRDRSDADKPKSADELKKTVKDEAAIEKKADDDTGDRMSKAEPSKESKEVDRDHVKETDKAKPAEDEKKSLEGKGPATAKTEGESDRGETRERDANREKSKLADESEKAGDRNETEKPKRSDDEKKSLKPDTIAEQRTEKKAERDNQPVKSVEIDDREDPSERKREKEAEASIPTEYAKPARSREMPVAEVSAAREVESRDDADELTGREKTFRAIILGLLLFAAAVAVYQPAWNAGFIWDDDIYVTANPLLTAADGLKKIWLSLESPSQYFPLVYTSFRFEHALWGLNPAGYHWVNILLHAANAVLLWRLLTILRIPGAWLAAGLFALHPVQVESVAWISERKNVLMGFFYLLALIAWVKFVAGKHKGEIKFYLLALVLYLLALFSKTTACTLPVALFLISWLKRGSVAVQRVLQIVPFVIFGLVMGLVSIWWERFHQGTQGQLFSLGIIERLLVAARAFWFYLGKLFWPAELAFSYPRWPISTADPSAYIWLGGCVLLAFAIWVLRRWLGRGPEVALVFFAATLAPTLGFIMLYTFRYTFVADHYQYIACLGPLALVAAGITAAINRLGRARLVLLPIVSALLLVPLGWRTWQYAGTYKDQETLWRATIAVNPESWMAHNNLAILLLKNERVDEAIGEFQEAIRLDPNYAEAHYNLGNAFLRQSRFAAARPHYEKALELNPNIAAARTNLALVMLETGEVEEAHTQLEAAVKIEPRSVLVRTRLGDTLMRLGRTDEAIAQYTSVLEIDPNDVNASRQLARYHLERRRFSEAQEHARQVAAATPNDAPALINLGIIAGETGKAEEAIAHFRKALDVEPENPEAHYNLGFSYLQLRDRESALQHFQRALEIRPNYPAAQMNLANVYAETDRLEEAVTAYKKALEMRPNYSLAHKNLATVLNRLGRFDEAMEHLQTSWRLDEQARSRPTP